MKYMKVTRKMATTTLREMKLLIKVNTELLDRSKNNVGTINNSNKWAMVLFNLMSNKVFISYLHRLYLYIYI